MKPGEALAVDKAMQTLEAMAETWAEKIGLPSAIQKIHMDPAKVEAFVKTAYMEGVYLGRTSHEAAA